MTDTTLFVFYKLISNCYWSYNNFPNRWKWIGSGRTTPIGSKMKKKYTHEEQFSGPVENNDEMILFLEKTFNQLKQENVVECFKIKETYH